MTAPTSNKTAAPRDTAKPSDRPAGQKPGKGRRDAGGKGRGGRDKAPDRAPAGRVVETSVVVDRAGTGQVTKKTRTSFPGATVLGITYEVVFEGHPPLPFDRLGQARERLKEGAPADLPAAAAEQPDAVQAES